MKKKRWPILDRLGLIPHYEEDTLFLMGISTIIIFAVSAEARYEYINFGDGRSILALVFILPGIYFCIKHAFSNKIKPKNQKFFMLFFAVFINFFIGMKAGIYTLSNTNSWFLAFPILNIVSSFSLILLYRSGTINEEAIAENNTNLYQVIGGVLILIPIIYLSNNLFKNYWAITFSTAISYSTNFNKIIVDIPKTIKKLIHAQYLK